MLWFILALGTAVFESLKNVAVKTRITKTDEYSATFAWRLWVLVFTLPFLAIFGIPVIKEEFWFALGISGILNVVAVALMAKAFKNSDLSLASPMIAFTPLFLLFTSPLILGEFPSATGMIGVFAIVTGSYVLNTGFQSKDPLEPLAVFAKEKGALYMLGVAFIWSVSANFDKVAVQNSSPAFYAVAINSILVIGALAIMIAKKSPLRGTDFKELAPAGVFNAAALLLQYTAISMAFVAYVVSIKRLSIVLDVIFGHVVLKEQNVQQRLAGALIMVVGVMLIALFS